MSAAGHFGMIAAGALFGVALACTPPPPHATLTNQVDAGVCRAGLDDAGASDAGRSDAGACAQADAAADHQ